MIRIQTYRFLQNKLALQNQLALQTALALLAAALSPGAAAQDVQTHDLRGMPPRATPADYQAHAQAGGVTVAAEFTGHSVPTPEQVLSTENYVIMEVGLFGAPGARLTLSHDDFSIRVNGKKTTTPGQPFGAIFKSLKDPEYVPPEPAASKSKGGISTGGGGRNQADPNSPPPVIHIPIEVERAMEQRVQKASLAEGDRPLPQAGLIYFEYGGKVSGIHSLELIDNGPAGKAVLTLQP